MKLLPQEKWERPVLVISFILLVWVIFTKSV